MKTFSDLSLSQVLILLVIIFFLLLILQYNWKRRWLYYYASKFEGPPSWPLVGNAHLLRSNSVHEIGLKLCETNKPIFKFWLGTDLLIFNSVPEDIEIVLNTHAERVSQVKYVRNAIGDGLLAGPSRVWKPFRKIMNPAFSSDVLNSFIPVFATYSTRLVKEIKKNYYKNDELDLFKYIFRCTLDIACETIADVKSDHLSNQDEFITTVIRGENIVINLVLNISLNPKWLWNLYSLLKELKYNIVSQGINFVKQVIKINDNMTPTISENANHLKRKLILHILKNHKEKNKSFSDEPLLKELGSFLMTSSETTAITIYHTLLVLGIYPKIQKHVHEEIDSIFQGSEEDVNREDILKMDYLERVIKETLRFMPTVPFTGRYIEENVEINSRLYPKGSNILIFISYLHRNPDLWDDPLEFNPDRFLPEENKKRHRCSYIPFSHGPRNCIGWKYAMISMKIILGAFLRHYEISSPDLKSIHDIKLKFGIVIKSDKAYKVILKPRKK